jgi:CelD/BcsL family acetyltransferase involved in cellulose biosynthesis
MFFEYLNTLPEKWNSVELYDISEDRKSLFVLNKMANSVRPGNMCLFTRLPNSSDTFLSTIKRKDRKEFRRNLRRLQKDGFKLDLTDYSEKTQITKGMNILFSIHQKRWAARGFPGKFSDPDFRSFCMDIAECFSKKGWLGLYCLELSGKPVASLWGFKYKSKYYAYDTGMDPAYGSYGVGSLLFLNVMNKCIQDGMNEFDFMWGTDEYKKQWNPTLRLIYNAALPRAGTLSHFKYLLYREYWSQGGRLSYLYKKLLER